MTTNQEFPDPAAGPVDISRVCTASDAPWDARNDLLADAIRLSAEKPAEAEAQVRRLLEQGININARAGTERTALELADYCWAPASITSMLTYASREGRAQAGTPSAPPVAVPTATERVLDIEFRGSARDRR